VRQGYVLAYDAERRVPRWVAYHYAGLSQHPAT
jgi:hypothetical protein